jgi:hypothetical protein
MICSNVDLSWGGSTHLLLGVLKTVVSHIKVCKSHRNMMHFAKIEKNVKLHES